MSKVAFKWHLQWIKGEYSLASDYAVAQCPKCNNYLSAYLQPNFGCDKLGRSVIFSAHVYGPDTFREVTILTSAKNVQLPPYCAFCGQKLEGSEW